jgi:uncharacterized protein YegL
MSFRPGAQLAARPLHVVFLLDCSGSMATDGKIDALNRAVRESLPALQDLVAQNPFVDVRVRVLTFSDGARWHLPDPTPVASATWPPVVAGGFTDLGAALRLLAPALESPPLEPRAFPPVLVLVSDGRPTDDFEAGLAHLRASTWGPRSVRAAIAIGSDVDLEVLEQFIGDPSSPPLTAHDPEQLAYLVRVVSTVASRVASAAVEERPRSLDVPPPPKDESSVLRW